VRRGSGRQAGDADILAHGRGVERMNYCTVDQARERMLAIVSPLPAESVRLQDALGRVLSEAVIAGRDLPPFRASAMDGYALRAADAPGVLKVIGESAAGRAFEGCVAEGQVVRVFTGAPVPFECDTVVVQENIRWQDASIAVPAVKLGQNIRAAGGDFGVGARLLEAGMRLNPWRLSLAAAAGRDSVRVAVRPRVAVFSTGLEIVTAPAEPGPWQIYESNAWAIAAMVAVWGGLTRHASLLGDDLSATIEALRDADAEVLVTLGGASVGDHDMVREAALALGVRVDVERVAMRPGKPTFFGALPDGRLLLALPGNPAAAFVAAELFLGPLIAAHLGGSADVQMVPARLARPLGPNGPSEHWLRARLAYSPEGLMITCFADQDSSRITVFAATDALVRRPPDDPPRAVGEHVEIRLLARG
jgi:molybdopterin molybdotransferase